MRSDRDRWELGVVRDHSGLRMRAAHGARFGSSIQRDAGRAAIPFDPRLCARLVPKPGRAFVISRRRA